MDSVEKKRIGLLQHYLHEYLEVNGVEEHDLADLLEIACVPSWNSVMIVDALNNNDVKLGVKVNNNELEVFGAFTYEKDLYPKTMEYIKSL